MRLLLICLCSFSFTVAADSIPSELQTCLASVPVNHDARIDLADRCPAYFFSLHDRGLLQTLEPLSGQQLSAQQLQLLNALIKEPTQTWPLDYSGLDGLLAEILIAPETDQSEAWWNSFLSWLKSLKTDEYEQEFQWLITFLEGLSLSEQTVRHIFYGLIILFSALAVGLVLYECYISGLFFRVARKRPIKQALNGLGNNPGKAALPEIKQLDSSAQIAALLAHVINYLTTQQNLPGDTSLTNLELIAYLDRQ